MFTKVVTPPKRSVSPKAVASPKSNSATPPRLNSVTSSPKRTLSKDGSAKSSIESVSPPKKVASPPTVAPAPVKAVNRGVTSPPVKVASPPMKVVSPPSKVVSPPSKVVSPPMKVASPPINVASPPPIFNRSDSKLDNNVTAVAPKTYQQQRDIPFRAEKLSLVATEADVPNEIADLPPPEPEVKVEEANRGEESNGVGDKIKIFEKAAEDAASAGRLSRPGSMRRPRTERLPSDELPPPPVEIDTPAPLPERHTSVAPREPQKIVRPEFRPLASPAEVTIRSPSLGSKAPECFPSHGTAFRNVAAAPLPSPTVAPEPLRARELDEEDSDFKTCKLRGRERPAVSRGSSYFTRGSEEIWLVKKKDIEEIEERVLDSFRRAGVRGGASTTVRGRRGYARSESLEATRGEWAGKAHTLKRQSSVACTCGHDKKARARSHGGEPSPSPRPRTRSHGETDAALLDKYETLV